MILGEKEVLKNLDNVIKIVAKTQKEALEETGQRGVAILKSNTPVDSGRMRNSESYTIGNKVKGYDDKTDALKPSNDDDSVIIGTNVIYGPSVEYMATNGSQGFMLRSYNQIKPIAKKIFETVLGRGLK